MRTRTGHVVVDGSNIATEGRSMPSLAQLNDAVLAFLEEFPGTTVTVVVDATFGHRIEKSEVKEFDSAIANNELVAPPAGAVGRGDAFVLSIANKAGAAILSNDSFQEFHGDYPWLFDDGRLVGGKPVPHVGWVFVDRVPVRGPVSRKAVRDSQSDGDSKRSSGRARRDRGAAARTVSKEASQPMPVPQSPPPGKAAAGRVGPDESAARAGGGAQRSRRRRGGAKAEPATTDVVSASTDESARVGSSAPASGDPVNELMPFLDFVENHPVGTSVNAIVDSYSSHGAYVRIGDVRGYVPLRLMADPPPRSAREVMKIDDAVTLVVASFAPARRSIDCAMPHMATDLEAQDPATVIEAAHEATPDSRTEQPPAATELAATPKKAASKRATTKKVPAKEVAAKKVPAKKVAAKKVAAKKAASKRGVTKKAPAKKVATKQAPANTAVADEAPTTETSTPTAAKKSAARKAAAKTAASQAAAKKTAAKTTPAKKATTKKAAAKRAAAKKAAAKKSATGARGAGRRGSTADAAGQGPS